MSVNGSSSVDELALEALRSVVAKAETAELALQKGINMGIEHATRRHDDDSRLAGWDRILKTVERIADKVLDRLDAAELRRLASTTAPPSKKEAAQLPEGAHAKILMAISKRPPPAEAAELLASVEVTQGNLGAILDQIRTGPGWTEFLAEDPAWLDAVRSALPPEVVAPEPEATT